MLSIMKIIHNINMLRKDITVAWFLYIYPSGRKGGSNMNIALRQRTGSVTELRQPAFTLQSLNQCLDLLETSLERYEYLKNWGAPDIVLYTEKGLIDRQLLLLSKVHAELTK